MIINKLILSVDTQKKIDSGFQPVSILVLQYLLLVIDFHLLLMTDFLFMARIKKRTFPVRSSKSTTTKIFQKEGNALCVMILQNYY